MAKDTYTGTPTVNTNIETVELVSLAERTHDSVDDAKLVPAGQKPAEEPKKRATKKR